MATSVSLALLLSVAAAAGELLPLPESGLVPVLEVAGPAQSPPVGFMTGAAAAETPLELVVMQPAVYTGPTWGDETGGYFELGGRFLPVSGRLFLRARILPAAEGPRTLKMYAYGRSASAAVYAAGRELGRCQVGKQAPATLAVTLADTSEVVLAAELEPLFAHCFLAVAWSGGAGDRVLLPAGVTVEDVAVQALACRFSPPAPRPGEEVRVDFAKWPAFSQLLFGARAPECLLRLPAGEPLAGCWARPSGTFRMPASEAAAWELRLELGNSQRALRLPNPHGLQKAHAALAAKAAAIPLAERRRYPVFLLRTEQIEEALSGAAMLEPRQRALEWLDEAQAAFEVEKSGAYFYAGKSGFREDAYVSDVDLSPQPFLLNVPAHSPPPWPLVVYLHGYVPSYTRSDWIGPNAMELAMYERLGAMYVAPFGRSNTDFLTVGERDVMDVIAEACRRFPIDADRIYLVGYSMGGSGAWTLMSHYPDTFAAALILAGRTDFYYWHDLEPAGLAPWLNFMIKMDNAIDHAENVAHVPVTVLHGDVDWVVKHGHSTRMVERLTALGGKAELFRLTGADHWRAGAALFEESIVKRLFSHRRSRQPAGRYVAYTPKYGTLGGAHIEAFEEWLAPAQIEFRAGADGAAEIVATNAARIRLSATGCRLPGFEEVVAGMPLLCTRLAAEKRSPLLAKTPALSGCFKDVFCGPFAIVYGTRGQRAAELAVAADAWADTWYQFAKGKALVFADDRLPAEVFESRHLILIGDFRENAIAGRLAPYLPFTLDETGVTLHLATDSTNRGLAAGRQLLVGGAGANEGYIITYPNLLTGKYAAFTGVAMWGEGLAINHKWDFVPDILVFRQGGDGFMGSDKYMYAGFFDARWQPDERLLFRGHKAAPPAP